VDWNPASIASPGATAATVTVNYPQTVIADFAPLTGGPPANYAVSQIVTLALASTSGRPINNFGQVVGYGLMFPSSAFLWTPTTVNGSVGDVIGLGGLPISAAPSNVANAINDRGQVVGTTTAQSSSAEEAFLWAPATVNAARAPFFVARPPLHVGWFLPRGSGPSRTNGARPSGPRRAVGSCAATSGDAAGPLVSPRDREGVGELRAGQ